MDSSSFDLSTGNKLAFGIGGFGKNLAFGLVSTYTLYYYNSVLCVSASFVGALLMLARIFDAFNDPFMGIVVAKTKSRYGRYKPWILTGAVLNAFVMYAMFSVPPSLTGGGLKTYITITYFLCGITYTLSDIPFWSVIPAITKSGHTRESLTSFARIFAGIGAGTPTVIVLFLVRFFGGGSGTDNARSGFSIVALIFSIIYVITAVITVVNLPDSELSETGKTASVKELIFKLIKNDQAMSVSLIIVLFTTASYLTTNLILYIFQYDIGHEKYYTPYTAVIASVQIFSMAAYSVLRKRYRNRTIFFISGGFGLASYFIFTVLAFLGNYSASRLIFPGILYSISNGLFYVMITIFISSAVDYGERQSGTRENSMVSSLQTLMCKLSSAFAILFAGIGIDIAKINQQAAVQTAGSALVLRILFSVPSLLLTAIAVILFIRKKDLGND